jgi:hypothetical protein
VSTLKEKELKMPKSGRFIFGRAIFICSTKMDENEARCREQNHLVRDKKKEQHKIFDRGRLCKTFGF